MDAAPAAGPARWGGPVALLAVEFFALSVAIEFPRSGSAVRLVAAAQTLIPVVIGAGAAGLLIGRHVHGTVTPLAGWSASRGRWGMLLAQLAAYAVTAALGNRLMGEGARPVGLLAFTAWIACVGATFALAAALVAPPRELARHALRHLATPLLAAGVGVLSWRAMAEAERLWHPLQAMTLEAVATILRMFRADVLMLSEESVLGVGEFEVEIAPVCSGVDGLGLVAVFQAVWLSLARRRLHVGRAALILVPAGLAGAVLANVLRIAALLLLGASGHPTLALGAFHSKLGWILFLGVVFVTVALAEHVAWFARDREAAPGAAPPDAGGGGVPRDAAAHVGPLVGALAAALVASLAGEGAPDRYYGVRLVAALGILWAVRRQLPAPALSFTWPPLALAAGTAALWIGWGSGDPTRLGDALAALPSGERAAWIAVRLAGAVLVIPLVEELAFRGFLLRWLSEPHDLSVGTSRAGGRVPWTAVLVSSLAFGALHDRFLLGTVAGIAFALARLRRGRLGDAVLAHAACNAILAAAALLGRWGLWG